MAESDAAKRAAARKAKIIARGNSGLTKLAQTARGEEAETLYGGGAGSGSPQSTKTQQTQANPTRQPANPTQAQSTARTQPTQNTMTPEQREMSERLNSMFGSMDSGEMPDMQQLLAQMMGGGGGGGGGGGPNLLGDLDDPVGLGMPQMPDMSALGNMGGLGDMGGMFPRPRNKVNKWFPLVHTLSTIMLALVAMFWWAPPNVGKNTWSHLSSNTVQPLPVFWAFTTIELILQTTRFMILASPPPPHSLLSNFLPLLPPKIARPLITGSRYITLLSQTYKDGALLVFVIGMVIICQQV